jgi:hypothetical protein
VTEQLDFKFFWPLTEQIPLELDYTDCAKPQLTYPYKFQVVAEWTITFASYPTGITTITASNLSLDIDTTTIKVKDTPNLCSRIIYKCLGLKWEKK